MSMTEIQRFGTSASLRRSAQVAFARKDTVGNPAAHPFVTWVLLVGILLPPIQIIIADVKFTPGRIVVFLFVLPAIGMLFQKSRRAVPADWFVVATAAWMILASIFNGGFRLYVVAEAGEFLFAYLIGRAYFLGRPALECFLGIFKIVACCVVFFALLDTLSGQQFTLKLFGAPTAAVETVLYRYRFGLVRAGSTFEGGELFGTFCVAAAAIFIFSVRNLPHRIFYAGVCLFGCFLSLSSGPLLGAVLLLGTVTYDFVLRSYKSRWKALVAGIALALALCFLISNHPIQTIIRHLTFDPQTGYFRITQWELSFEKIAGSPIVGYSFGHMPIRSWQEWVYIGHSIDAVYLVEMLRYGIPLVVFLVLSIYASFFSTVSNSSTDDHMARIRLGFSCAIVIVSIIGLTVHFWNSIWIFFSLCIGIRASFVEFEARRRSRPLG
jgi:hypothetical protein